MSRTLILLFFTFLGVNGGATSGPCGTSSLTGATCPTLSPPASPSSAFGDKPCQLNSGQDDDCGITDYGRIYACSSCVTGSSCVLNRIFVCTTVGWTIGFTTGPTGAGVSGATGSTGRGNEMFFVFRFSFFVFSFEKELAELADLQEAVAPAVHQDRLVNKMGKKKFLFCFV